MLRVTRELVALRGEMNSQPASQRASKTRDGRCRVLVAVVLRPVCFWVDEAEGKIIVTGDKALLFPVPREVR